MFWLALGLPDILPVLLFILFIFYFLIFSILILCVLSTFSCFFAVMLPSIRRAMSIIGALVSFVKDSDMEQICFNLICMNVVHFLVCVHSSISFSSIYIFHSNLSGSFMQNCRTFTWKAFFQKPWPADNFKKYKRKQIPKKKAIF